VTLLDKISDKKIRLFYVKHAIEHGWSRNIMVMQMELSLHKRQGQAITNFKDKDFKPEYADKMNFYLSCVDDLVKHETDRPSIGLILCKSKNNILAEYTLRDMTKPIGLAEYRLKDALPENLQTAKLHYQRLKKSKLSLQEISEVRVSEVTKVHVDKISIRKSTLSDPKDVAVFHVIPYTATLS